MSKPFTIPGYWHFVCEYLESTTKKGERVTTNQIAEATGLGDYNVKRIIIALQRVKLLDSNGGNTFALLKGLPSHIRQHDWCKWVALCHWVRNAAANTNLIT